MLAFCFIVLLTSSQVSADDCKDDVDDCSNADALKVICEDSASAQFCKRSCNLCPNQTLKTKAQGASGTVFMIGFPHFTSLIARFDHLQLTIFTAGNTDTKVKLCSPGLNNYYRREVVVKGTSFYTWTIDMSMKVEDANKTMKGILIVSENPIIVYGWEMGRNSIDSLLAVPLESLGNIYYVLTCSYKGSMSEILLIGVHDQTNIRIKLPENLVGNVTWSGTLLKDNRTIINHLNKFETLQIQAKGDLSGAYIESSSAIGVIVANERTLLRRGRFLDNILEMIPSVEKWGKHFICVGTPQNRSSDLVRVLAKEQNTTVRIMGAVNKTFKMAEPGEVLSFDLPVQKSVEIIADNPVLVGQYYTRDPAFAIIPPVEQWEEEYTFVIPDSYSFEMISLIVVVRVSDLSNILLDGSTLNSHFQHVNSGFWKTIVQVNRGKHVLSIENGTTFGALIFGYADNDYPPQTYFTPAGMKQRTISTIGNGKIVQHDRDFIGNSTLIGFDCFETDHFTASFSGCQCGFDSKLYDCACCQNGGCQFGLVNKNKCFSCHQLNLCGQFPH